MAILQTLQKMDTLRFAACNVQVTSIPSHFTLSPSVDALVSYEFPVPQSFELEYNSVASYSDLKRLSSWFGNDDDDDLFPTAASTTAATTASSSQDATIPTATASGPPDLMNDLTHDTNNKKIIEMHKLTLVAEEDCVFYLESMNWDVSAAVKSYYDCLR